MLTVGSGQVQADVSTPRTVDTSNALTGASRMRLSSAASDALLKYGEYASGAKAAATPATVSIEAARAEKSATHPSGIPADKVAWLNSFGADSWAVRERPRLDEGVFEKQVLDTVIRNGSAKLAGFSDALANGTLKIQRASDMPELGFRSYQISLYKDGSECGGVGFSVCNNDHRMEMRANGIYAGTGSVDGNDYVVTWPMPDERAGGSADPAVHAAA
jgi:hypothetical protein